MSESLVKVEIRLNNIDTDFKLLAKKDNSKSDVFTFNISSELQIFDTKKEFVIIQSIDIVYENEENVLATFKIAYSYYLSNFYDIVHRDENNNILVRNQVVEYLNNACLNTSRGIIFENLKSTFLSSAILPLMQLPGLKPIES